MERKDTDMAYAVLGTLLIYGSTELSTYLYNKEEWKEKKINNLKEKIKELEGAQ